MSFASILFEHPAQVTPARQTSACFQDLHLDRIIASIITGREEYDLQAFFQRPLREVAAVQYRHAVFRDLEDRRIGGCVRTFAERMRRMRVQLAQAAKLHYERQQQRRFLDAVGTYCAAVLGLAQELPLANTTSSGLSSFARHLQTFIQSALFTTLQADTESTYIALTTARYSLHIEGTRIRVSRYAGERDYTGQVRHTFEKFAQGSTKDYQFVFAAAEEMDHVEAAVLDRVALLYPEVFSGLNRYCQDHHGFLDETIRSFDREVQFYLAALQYVGELQAHGLAFCYPQMTDRSREVFGRDVFDVALAEKLVGERHRVVTNDFELHDPQRVVVVSGPNQGGKTTFARTFGQMHYLGSLGCPVPGSAARLFLCDELFTLFEREEHLENLSGKLEEELLRLHGILGQATSYSILIMNETLGSTTLSDALSLGRRVLQQIIERGMLCVYVTFLEELARLGASTLSMVSTVVPTDPAQRTFKVVQRPADGRAYALAIARKYHLTEEDIRERMRS